MDIVSSTTHVWLMYQQTHITSVIYATRRGLHTNGHIMKVKIILQFKKLLIKKVYRWTIACCFLMKMITDVDKNEHFNRHNELQNRIALITAVYFFFWKMSAGSFL